MNSLLRKSASMASFPTKRALSLLITIETSRFFSSLPPSQSLLPKNPAVEGGEIRNFDGSSSSEKNLGFFVPSRNFHFSAAAPLGFRASDAVRAEYAVADFSDEEKGPGKKSSDCEEGLEISKLGIAHEIVSALANKGITRLFPIQRAVLEPAMQGRDMIGRARTGTGKTLAFAIPILDKIIQFNAKHGRGRNPLALVLAPTRELARQVEKEFNESTTGSILDTLCVYGGVPISSQMRTLDYGVDVVVGTPGRIIDLLKRGALNLSEVQFVVLDEADQMLAVGFEEAVEEILDKLPQNRQSMMFSATMPSWIRSLTNKYLKDPLTIDLVGDSDQKLADGISLYSIASDVYGKQSILGPLITEHAKGGKCIIFTQTKRDADRLAYSMGRSLSCEALHGDISQNQRERTLSGFRDGRFNILVATDVAARGLDVPNVDLVIHYELPNSSEIFVHRSGRTGRAGKKGSAILIYTDQQTRALRVIEQDIGCKFKELPRINVEGNSRDIFDDMGGGRFGSFGGGGRMSDSGFGRSGGYGGSGFGRSGGFGSLSSGRFGTSGGSSPGRSGWFGASAPGRSGGFGSPGADRPGGFGSPGADLPGGFGSPGADRPGGFGSPGADRPGGFGDFGPGRSGGFGSSGIGRSGGFGSPGADRPGGFGDFGSGRSGGFGSSGMGRSVGFGDSGSEHPGGFGNSGPSHSGRLSDFGSGRSSNFGDSGSSGFGGSGSHSRSFGGSGIHGVDDEFMPRS